MILNHSGKPRRDRFGIGWRPAIAADIIANIAKIDLLELIAEDWIAAGAAQRRAMAMILGEVPLTVHGVALGPASAAPVPPSRVKEYKKLIKTLQPDSWSEHMAFVRSGNIEIGHLAAPPRTESTISGAASNLAVLSDATGMTPRLENIATLLEPPGCGWTEVEWIRETLRATGAPMLLDLHNLHANAVNFGFDAVEALRALSLQQIRGVHLAGGRMIRDRRTGRTRLLDDHLHSVPDPVFHLLEVLASIHPAPLDIIIERDGCFPEAHVWLAELERAREAVRQGRAQVARVIQHPLHI